MIDGLEGATADRHDLKVEILVQWSIMMGRDGGHSL
jgi:hypothetical protein